MVNLDRARISEEFSFWSLNKFNESFRNDGKKQELLSKFNKP